MEKKPGQGVDEAERKAIVSKSTDRNFLEAALQNVEAFVDSTLNNPAIEAVPIVSTAVKALKGLDDVRSGIFAAKILEFIAEPYLQSDEGREKMRRKAIESPDESRKVGQTLLLVLDRLSDMDKPQLLSRIFVAYLNDFIGVDDFRRMAQAIDLAYGPDLKSLLEEPDVRYNLSDDGTRPWMTPLAATGLTRFRVGGRPVGPPKPYFEITELGVRLWHAVRGERVP